MSSKKSVDKSTSFMKPSRKPFPQNGIAVLFKSKDAPAESAKGIKVLPLNPNGQPDWMADAYVIWFNELDMLRKGTMPRIGVFLAEYRPKPEAEA